MWVWLGPVLAFVGAMIALWITNMRADRREWNKWRRDTLIKLCADATESARLVETACMASLDETYESASKKWDEVGASIDRVAHTVDQLHLIGAHYLAAACSELESVLLEFHESTTGRYAFEVNVKTQAELRAEEGEQLDASYYEQQRSIANKHVDLLVQIDPARAKLIRRGQIELKSTSR